MWSGSCFVVCFVSVCGVSSGVWFLVWAVPSPCVPGCYRDGGLNSSGCAIVFSVQHTDVVETTQSGMDFEGLTDGWEVWNVEQAKAVLTYRPDIFDTDAYPPACLPTIHVTKGQRGRRPGRHTPSADASWYVTLYLEPEVADDQQRYETREEARDGAVDLAMAFAQGEIDYRSLYQVPRPAYLDQLDELTGRET